MMLVVLHQNSSSIPASLPLAARTTTKCSNIGFSGLCGPVPPPFSQYTLPVCRSPPPSPPPLDQSPPACKPIEIPAKKKGRWWTKVKVVATLTGTLDDWASRQTRAAFEAACEKSFDARCCVGGVAAGSVVLDFTLVQYADEAKGAPLADKLADVAIAASFRAAVLAATGTTFVSAPKVVSVTNVSADGAVLFDAPISGGALAGIVVVACVLVLGCGAFAYRARRRGATTRADGGDKRRSVGLHEPDDDERVVAQDRDGRGDGQGDREYRV